MIGDKALGVSVGEGTGYAQVFPEYKPPVTKPKEKGGGGGSKLLDLLKNATPWYRYHTEIMSKKQQLEQAYMLASVVGQDPLDASNPMYVPFMSQVNDFLNMVEYSKQLQDAYTKGIAIINSTNANDYTPASIQKWREFFESDLTLEEIANKGLTPPTLQLKATKTNWYQDLIGNADLLKNLVTKRTFNEGEWKYSSTVVDMDKVKGFLDGYFIQDIGKEMLEYFGGDRIKAMNFVVESILPVVYKEESLVDMPNLVEQLRKSVDPKALRDKILAPYKNKEVDIAAIIQQTRYDDDRIKAFIDGQFEKDYKGNYINVDIRNLVRKFGGQAYEDDARSYYWEKIVKPLLAQEENVQATSWRGGGATWQFIGDIKYGGIVNETAGDIGRYIAFNNIDLTEARNNINYDPGAQPIEYKYWTVQSTGKSVPLEVTLYVGKYSSNIIQQVPEAGQEEQIYYTQDLYIKDAKYEPTQISVEFIPTAILHIPSNTGAEELYRPEYVFVGHEPDVKGSQRLGTIYIPISTKEGTYGHQNKRMIENRLLNGKKLEDVLQELQRGKSFSEIIGQSPSKVTTWEGGTVGVSDLDNNKLQTNPILNFSKPNAKKDELPEPPTFD